MARPIFSGFENGDDAAGTAFGFTFGNNVVPPSFGASRNYDDNTTAIAITPAGTLRSGWVQFRFKIERLPSNGDGRMLIHEMRNGSTNPSGLPGIILTSTGTLEFLTYGLTPSADALTMMTSSALTVGQWYLIEYHTVMNTATQVGGAPTETNATFDAWIDGIAVAAQYAPTSVATAIGIHITVGSFQATKLCNNALTGVASATNGIVCFDDYILDSSARCDNEHIVGLRPNGLGSYTAWTNVARGMAGNLNNSTTAVTSTTAQARVSYFVPTLRSLGINGSTIGDAKMLLFGNATGAGAGLFVIINGVETLNTVNLAASTSVAVPEASLFTVTIAPDDVVQIGYQKDNSATSRNFASLVLCVSVADDDLDLPAPSTSVQTSLFQYTGDGAAHQIVALPFEPDFLFVIPTGGTTNRLPLWWDSSSRQSLHSTTSVLSGGAPTALMVMRGQSEMVVTNSFATTGELNASAVVYDVLAIRDESRRLIQLGDFTIPNGEDNFNVALDDAGFPVDFFHLASQSAASGGASIVHGTSAVGDLSYRIGQSTGGETDMIQSVGTGTVQIGAAASIISSFFNPYFALSTQQFDATVLAEMIAWTGDGSSPRVINTATTAPVKVVLVIPCEAGASANGRRGHLRSPGFTSTDSRHLGGTTGGMSTTGITVLGSSSFTVGADANLSGQDYQALVFFEGLDGLILTETLHITDVVSITRNMLTNVILGVDADIQGASLAMCIGLDGNPHINTEDGKVLLGGDLNIVGGYLEIRDGSTPPTAQVGRAKIYIDTSGGDLKIIFGDGTIKTIVTDT